MNKFQISSFKFQISKKACLPARQGFTLIELLIVIAIIGILAGVVLVSSKSAVDKSKKASALTTASSTLSELVICGDDGGVATNSPPEANEFMCCTAAACGTAQTGHENAKWPDISKTGWSFTGNPTGTVILGTYKFFLTKDGGSGAGDDLITCDMAANGCSS